MKTFYAGIKGIVRSEQGFLLLKRTGSDGVDFWDVPGGRTDADETFEQTLVREFSEELPGSANLTIQQLAGANRLQRDIDGDISLILLYFIVNVSLPEEIQLSDEHTGYLWVSDLSALPKTGLNEELVRILEEQIDKNK